MNYLRKKNKMEKTKIGLTSFQIKIIALVIMTIDHLAAHQIITTDNDINTLMRMIGRIAAPLFLFLLVEGLRHTRSKKNYIIRLYIAGLIIQVLIKILPLILSLPGKDLPVGNIMQTFFYTALYITCIENITKRRGDKHERSSCMWSPARKIISVALMILPFVFVFKMPVINIFIPSPFGTEYSFFFVLLGIAWYFINNKYINCVLFVIFSVICRIVDYKIFTGDFFMINEFTFYHVFISYQWMMISAVLFMLLYNGEKGKGGFKYLFYLYYPAHQFLFLFLSVYILKR